MNIKNILRSRLNEIINNKVWYHGTPDVRELEKEGGFGERTTSVDYIENIDVYNQLVDKLDQYRGKDDARYHEVLNQIPKLKQQFKFRTPIFLTNDYSVAKSYADPNRSMDYQNSVEKVIKVVSQDGLNVKIASHGQKFRFIELNNVRAGFINAGVSPEEFDRVVSMFNFMLRDKTKIKTDMIGSIGEWFNIDTIDVIGVLDSYSGGNTKSTVRMAFNPQMLKIIK
jgi:hypothetical protein